MKYDSKKDTKKHIKRVSDYMNYCIGVLWKKAKDHDSDKINNVTEKSLFDEYSPLLKDCTYGSETYKKYLEGLKPALDIHYQLNRFETKT